MKDTSIRHIETEFTRVKKMARALSIVLNIVFYLFIAVWTINLICSCITFFRPDLMPASLLSHTGVLVSIFIGGILLVVPLKTGALILKDISKGTSPFTVVQANRVRMVAIVFLIYSIFDFLWSPDAVARFIFGHVSISSWSDGNPFTLHLNMGLITAAALFYSISVVFRYGVLLQNLSDETI